MHDPIRLLFVLLLAVPLPAQLRVAPVFGRHMVLQRETDAPVFGTARPGARVEVRGDWAGAVPVTAVAGADGRFRIDVRTPAAGGPFTLLVAADNEVQRFDDVLVGEVWICSGQSNMEWPLRAAAHADEEIASATLPRIRLLTVPNRVAAAPVTDFDAPWLVCSPDTARDFSAVGFAFGRALARELDVPIGLVAADWGGTPAEAWTPREAFGGLPEFTPALDGLAAIARDPAASEAAQQRAYAQWTRDVDAADPGLPGPGRPVGWYATCLDATGFSPFDVPHPWAGTELADFDGMVWYRRVVDVPAPWAGHDLVLELGAIDDDDRTWFDGVSVGATRGWNVPRRYVVPGRVVRGGRVAVTVRVHDTGGEGGFADADGLPRLARADGEGVPLVLRGGWVMRRGLANTAMPKLPVRPSVGPGSPTSLYNGMIAPLVPCAFRGAIWYQGESNVGRAEQYAKLFPAMISGWRAAFGRGDFPFLFVQIAPFGYGEATPGDAAELREAQRRTLTAIPNVGMAVTMDVGDPRDIHPTDKRTVGERLARWALAGTYGRDVEFSGPDPVRAELVGDALRITFAHADGLCTRDGAAPSHLEIAGADGVFHAAVAQIDGASLVVRADGVAAPVEVRYAFGPADQPNLVNGAGLPASSFRLRR